VTFGGHYVVLVGLIVLLAACRWSGRIPEMPGTRHVLGVVGLAILGAASSAGLVFGLFRTLLGWQRQDEDTVPDLSVLPPVDHPVHHPHDLDLG
jgi:hypothetical protein